MCILSLTEIRLFLKRGKQRLYKTVFVVALWRVTDAIQAPQCSKTMRWREGLGGKRHSGLETALMFAGAIAGVAAGGALMAQKANEKR